jgi:murein DD-endopeptidase MepM/ murein hydrolase activator NlpD
VVDRRSYALSTRRAVPPRKFDPTRGLPNLYRGSRRRAAHADLYSADHADQRQGGRFRWLVSTCLAAAVGALAIVVVIYGSADPKDSADGLMPALKRLRENAEAAALTAPVRPDDGLKWAVAKTDRLQITTGAMSTRFIIHETLKQRRNGREYIYAKPYVRIVSRLAAVPSNYADVIPPFNPFKLYADSKPVGVEDEDGTTAQRTDVSVKVVELLGGFLPGEDGQELDTSEVDELVERAKTSEAEASTNAAQTPEAQIGLPMDGAAAEPVAIPQAATLPNTTVLQKTTTETDDATDDLEGREVRVVKASGRDTLAKILIASGADSWQAREMLEPAKTIFPEDALTAGQEVYITLLPSLTQQNKMEPVRFSVFGDGHEHRVTVSRNAAGEFIASATPLEQEAAVRAALGEGDDAKQSSLYSSLYHAGLIQNIPSETIQQVLKVHAYETDFRRRLRAGDNTEYFFDLKQENGTDGPPGDLLYTAITTSGETARYYRFRTSDNVVDFYDADGNNSRKFLMRKPIRGDDLRLTSGFGVRYHPLLGVRKMHTGVDWAAAPGTPILAAGNGTIEEAGRKSAYGNYVRIRHANGYQTAYGHMTGFASGVEAGVKVKQGQIIGYVGSTGLSSGPHLHFEVLVNTRFVDPLSIQVPRERKLTDKDLADFQKERTRIDELMRRAPVMTATR